MQHDSNATEATYLPISNMKPPHNFTC